MGKKMANVSVLTIAFLENRPLESARALGEMDTGEAAAFLDTLPTRVLVRLVSQMGVSAAANFLAHMKPVNAAAVLRKQDYLLTTSILRLIPMEGRGYILEEMPLKLKRDFTHSLSFPSDTVGAHMITSIIMLGPNNLVSEACQELKRSKKAYPDVVFIVGEDRRLLGVVRSVLLFRYASDTLLGAVTEKGLPSLSARARLTSITDHSIWDVCNAVPVIGRNRHLVGALTRDRIIKGSQLVDESGEHQSSVIVSLVEVFFATIVSLMEVLTGTGEQSKPDSRGKKP